MTAGLVLDRLALRIHDRPLIGPLDLTVPAGVIGAVVGPSGVGKSTLLAVIAGIAGPGVTMAGRVWLDGTAIDGLPPEARRVGLMMQDDLLFPHLTVAANIGFGLPAGLSRARRRALIDAALAEAGLAGLGGRDPLTLSGAAGAGGADADARGTPAHGSDGRTLRAAGPAAGPQAAHGRVRPHPRRGGADADRDP
ncbi:ATP-binding cassette domain-containing protein [Tistrella bauzanensis]